MAIFFTSDQHFGHHRILELGEGRPFKHINEHNDYIIKQWVKTVSHDDTVYVLGDVALGGFEDFPKSIKIFSWLPGKKMLIPGNHDKIWSGNSIAYRDKNRNYYVDAGFTIMPENHIIDFPLSETETTQVLLSHVPYASHLTERDTRRAEKFKKQTPTDEGLPLIHGHTHSRVKLNGHPKSFHVGVDAHNFTPVSETEIREWLKTLGSMPVV